MIVETKQATFGLPLALESGQQLAQFSLAYETYGELNEQRNNAILVCHALTATQHAAGRYDAADAKPGWWDAAIGPGKAIDTHRFFVVSSNVLGGFGGSTGPASIEPGSGRPYGIEFPIVTITDMVGAQRCLADHLGVDGFHAVVGGCMGGFQVLEWLRQCPNRVANAIVISAGARVSTHTVALWKVLSDAIRLDPAWRGGEYGPDAQPDNGLALASRIGALFWMSREVMSKRFGLETVGKRSLSYSLAADFEVEAFLDKIGHGASQRIDANSLLYLMRAMSYFDLSRGSDALHKVFPEGMSTRVLLASYASDWRYPPDETEAAKNALVAAGAEATHRIFDSDFGHGAFIYDFHGLGVAIREFL